MKKVLIVTYYWPPAGGGGVQRWLKIAKYLPENGWEPIIVAPENAEYPSYDETLLQDIAPETKVIKVPIWEPYKLFKLITGKKKTEKVNTGFLFDDKKKGVVERMSLWLRGNILIPDPRVFWVRPVVKHLQKVIREIQPDVIITTGPPHSVHLIGLKISRKNRLKWVADFRDPWSTIDYLDFFNLSKFAKRRQQTLERDVLQNANLVLSVSENWKQELVKLGANKVAVVTNGYDADDFINYKKRSSNQFVLTYTGLITSLRNPTFLWNILENMLSENKELANKFELRLIGNIDNQVLTNLNEKPILSGKVNHVGYLSHAEVIEAYSESSMLLLLLNQSDNSKGHIPGKLFEYLAAQMPILAIGNKKGDVARILSETNAGKIFCSTEIEAIKEFVSEKSQSLNFCENLDIVGFSRQELTKKVVQQLDKLKE